MRSAALYTSFDLIPGGGERYLLSVAATMADEFELFLITKERASADVLRQLGNDVGVPVDHITPLSLADAVHRAPFDVFFALGNEAVPPVEGIGHRNIFICQFPYPSRQQEARTLRWRWDGYDEVVLYSEYVRPHILEQFRALEIPSPTYIDVIHPPVERISPARDTKRDPKSIISVGRFFEGQHSKRQDELIAGFRMLLDRTDATLHLAGTVTQQAFFERCRDLAQGAPVHFYPNASRADIGRLYNTATCYWHGAGLNADRRLEPGNFEHFGIAVVEAMSEGCVPFVLDWGGPAGTVRNGIDGWTYHSVPELVEKTYQFMRHSPSSERTAMRAAATARAMSFGPQVFRDNWRKLLAAEHRQTERQHASGRATLAIQRLRDAISDGTGETQVSAGSVEQHDDLQGANHRDSAGVSADLPQSFHFWSNEYVRPAIEAIFGVRDPDHVYAEAVLAVRMARGPENIDIVSLASGTVDLEMRVARILLDAGLRNFSILACHEGFCVEAMRRQIDAAGLQDFVRPTRASIDELPLPTADVIFADYVFSRTRNLERLLDACSTRLASDGVLVTSDLIGRNGHQRWPEAAEVLRVFWPALSERQRFHHQLGRRDDEFEDYDCSADGHTGIRAEDVLPLLLDRFHPARFVGVGGFIELLVGRGYGPGFDVGNLNDVALLRRAAAYNDVLLDEGRMTPTLMLGWFRKEPGEERYYRERSAKRAVRRRD